MARFIKLKSKEDRLKEKKKSRYMLNLQKTISFLQLIALVYICYKLS